MKHKNGQLLSLHHTTTLSPLHHLSFTTSSPLHHHTITYHEVLVAGQQDVELDRVRAALCTQG
jgi:hypothetical protein